MLGEREKRLNDSVGRMLKTLVNCEFTTSENIIII